ncbi:MAG TPA: energy transducer TonB [Pyrinomonadaceae bacterium]|nr:energy transducer TonB [Pyrinomonadaceae bacterium]
MQFEFCPVDGTPLPNGYQPADTNTTATNNFTHERTASTDAVNDSVSADATVATVAAAQVPAANVSTDDAATAVVPYERGEYHLTFLEDEGLLRRLAKEVREVGHGAELTWPEFKRDPAGFVKRGTTAYGKASWRVVSQRNVALGIMSALVLMITAGVMFTLLSRMQDKHAASLDAVREDLELQGLVTDIPEEQKKPDEGPAGNAKGKGGGSKPKQEKPGGGGGGGRQEAKPASFGKLPPASLEVPQVRAPDPRPPTIKNPVMPVAASIVADPTLFPPDNRQIAYGDPKSRSTETSSGPGSGNGIGTGTGGGVGSGEGGGVGPGRGGNTGGGDRNDGGGGPGGGGGGGVDYKKTFAAREVTRKAQITSKPEPLYTEEARKNQVTGTVRLRLILGASGAVSGITPVSRLPDGLTEKAIEAARRISFTPAEKDGRKVSQYVTIEYNFNIY